MRHLFVLFAVFAFALVAAPGVAVAQDSGVELANPGQEDGLMSGGGGGGTQFPDGTEKCSGDRQHHAHGYPSDPCVFKNNRHYATTMGGGDTCTNRSKLCSSCNTCCDMQHVEAEKCHCNGDDFCEAELKYVTQKCKESCTGHYLDGCI